MSYVISVYSQEAFKNFLLPAINNADSSIILYKDIFGLHNDVTLKLEVMNYQWRFLSSDQYVIKKRETPYENWNIKDDDVLSMTTMFGKELSILVKETENSFAVMKKFSLEGISQITIGSPKNPGCDIVYSQLGMVSKNHAILSFSSSGGYLRDTSANGTFVNSVRIPKEQNVPLQFGDRISILSLNLVYLGYMLAIDMTLPNLHINYDVLRPLETWELSRFCSTGYSDYTENEKHYFHRVPRNLEKIESEQVEIEAPPQPQRMQARSLLMTIGPSMTMAIPMLLGCSLAIFASRQNGSGSVFMYTGLVTAVSSAIIGTVWGLVNLKQAKKERAIEEANRLEAYGQYLNDTANEIETKYTSNKVALQKTYPSALACSLYDRNSLLLWNRNMTHEDFLFQRLGIGSIPFQVPIVVPKKRFVVYKDNLSEEPYVIQKTYEMLQEVPVGIDFKDHNLVGVIGGKEKIGAYQVAKALITQIAANNCYTDVKIGLIYDREKGLEAENLECIKWFPHVWSEDKKTRFVADNRNDAADVFYEIAKVLRQRDDQIESLNGKKVNPKPYYILFITDPSMLEGELISKYIFHSREEYGLSTVLLVEGYEDLPNNCEYIIQNDGKFQGVYSVNQELQKQQRIVFDDINRPQLETFARNLSNIEVNEIETGGEIPNSLTFLDMYHVDRIDQLNVENRWMKNRTYDSMKALIGEKAGGTPCYLDIHEKYHGPHGLVAGTTGSGKSETLQSYMLSLAINFSPDDIGFFIIDYKGGGMANLFSKLPHMMGQISNLSGNQVHRAMVSIKSENRRRQRLFNEHGVNNINQYTRLYKENEATIPIPHMFIIIDEFAELKREEPDFMRELISVAQVGRSLGVHLILATQKPSGTVDDNIWSNSKFRLCLRVQDRQDSNDMLHKPDAAYITQSGRCYLQVGNDELYELFQSGYSGAAYDDAEGSGKVDIAKMYSLTGKAALTGNRTKIKQKEKAKRQWITALVSIVENSLRNLMMQSDEIFSDSEKTEQIYEEIFTELKTQGFDYPMNEYNVRRMEELLKGYIAASTKTMYTEEKAGIILENAVETGAKLPEMKEKSQLDAIVEYLDIVAKRCGYINNFMLWMPILPEKIYLNELEGYNQLCFDGMRWPDQNENWNLNVMIGMCDDPVNQAQMPLEIDLAKNGHHAICGTVVSGKSTFLQSFIYALVHKYSPEYVNIYGLDFSSHMMGGFEKLAHVGGIMYENDMEKISKFFNLMKNILQERKNLLKGGSYAQYVQANGVTVPSIVIAIDQYANFREKTNNMYEDILLELSRDGAGYGIFLVITAAGFGSVDIQNRIADNIRTVICLEMSDKFQYADVMRTMHFNVLPEAGVKGRGLAKVGGTMLEFQTALSLDAKDDYARIDAIAAECDRMNAAWAGKHARTIPEIPEKPQLTDLLEADGMDALLADDRHLPLGYDMENASPYGIDLSRIFSYLITGKTRTGKTNTIKVLIHMAAKKGGKLCVIDTQGTLAKIAKEVDAAYVTKDSELFDYLKDLVPMFIERNKTKKAAVEEGLEDEEIYVKMTEYEPLFIFIDDLTAFIQMATHPSEGVGDMRGFLENITDKGSLHNVFFVSGYDMDQSAQNAGIRLYENMIRYKRGVHLGGNTTAQRIFTFDYMPFMEQGKTIKPGIGLLPSSEDTDGVHKVVIPMVRR